MAYHAPRNPSQFARRNEAIHPAQDDTPLSRRSPPTRSQPATAPTMMLLSTMKTSSHSRWSCCAGLLNRRRQCTQSPTPEVVGYAGAACRSPEPGARAGQETEQTNPIGWQYVHGPARDLPRSRANEPIFLIECSEYGRSDTANRPNEPILSDQKFRTRTAAPRIHQTNSVICSGVQITVVAGCDAIKRTQFSVCMFRDWRDPAGSARSRPRLPNR
jgi:hypothetical protein